MATDNIFSAEQRQLCRGTPVLQIEDWRAWLPVAVVEDGALVWRWLGEKRCTEAFFADTLRGQTKAERRVHQTPRAALPELLDRLPHLAPSAFIFHCSRCGSTLLMQMLACLPHCISLSEPPVLDAALTWLHQQAVSSEDACAYLQQVVAMLGQQRHAQEQHLIIKLDSWHVADLALLRAAFPQTPFYFLYRRPDAVLASHQRLRGPQMVPGLLPLARLGMKGDLPWADLNLWSDMLLQCFFEFAIHHAPASQLQLVNYDELPEKLWQQLLADWQISVDPAQLATMQECSKRDAKRATAFVPLAISPDLTASAELQGLYQHLEKLRCGAPHIFH